MIRFLIYISGVVLFTFSSDGEVIIDSIDARSSAITETFEFSSDGTPSKGKIYLPAAYETNRNLPAIYLIDFTEQQYKIATDEFEKVIAGVEQIQGFDALVVTLEEHLDIDSKPEEFQEYYDIFKNMASYVDGKYTNNGSNLNLWNTQIVITKILIQPPSLRE